MLDVQRRPHTSEVQEILGIIKLEETRKYENRELVSGVWAKIIRWPAARRPFDVYIVKQSIIRFYI